MNNFELKVKLKQHTPLIHFQYEQEGATLRASEVKPKLDSFLVEKGNIQGEWKLKDREALNYKLRLKASDKKTVQLGYERNTDNLYDIYYGNMGQDNYVEGVIAPSIEMTIICFIPELMKVIRENIAAFFLVNNFGKMHSKGFGSFTVSEIEYKGEKNKVISNPNKILDVLSNFYDVQNCYYFSHSGKPFKQIKTLYSIMKSGVNFQGYQRSLLFLYMHTLHICNEKAALKRGGYAPTDVGTHITQADMGESDEKEKYVRALLGVGDHIDFLMDLKDRKHKKNVSIKGSSIERMESPILFKIIDNYVYYVGRPIHDEIYGEKFTFVIEEKKDKRKIGTEQKPSYEVPSKSDLQNKDFIADFLEYCFGKLTENDRYILKKFNETKSITIQKYTRSEGGGN